MRRPLLAALAAACLFAPVAYAAPSPARPAHKGAVVTAEGFDKCLAPSSGAMRSWLASPYRVVNIYMGGNNRACADQPELSPQWLTTVTENGWSVIPTYVGSQAACTSSNKQYKIVASTAAQQGQQEADDAVTQMAALGLPAGANNPVYFDMEPYSTSNSTCDNAVLTFLNAWTMELHAKGYLSGVYGTVNSVVKQLISRQAQLSFTEPDAIWYADWNLQDSTTDDDAVLQTYWSGHRIHQYRGGHTETFNGQTFDIDNDAVAGDVVASATPPTPTGPPYMYAAAPPANTTLKEHNAPTTAPGTTTGVTYASGTALSITCQTTGDAVLGDTVWDQLSDGGFVSDIYTTTTGGLTFTAGLPNCSATPPPDTTPPTATMAPVPVATLDAAQPISWSGTDDNSGVASYDVQWERAAWNTGWVGWEQPARWTATTATSGSLNLAPGFDYCIHVRATDVAGNVGQWSAPVCVTRALDDRTLQPTSGWTRQTGSQFYLSTATATRAGHQQLTLPRARATRIGLVVTTCPTCGRLRVRVGTQVVGYVNLQTPGFHNRQIVMLRQLLTGAGKWVHLDVWSTNKLVRVDGLVITRH